MKHTKTKIPRKRIIIYSITAILCSVTLACGIYVSDYYPAQLSAISEFSFDESITKTEISETVTVYSPEAPTAGFIFYPGGKVEHAAYEPLLMVCAENGILCVLTEMPARLAILDTNAAEGIPELFPQISTWYIGGHSLGGSAAAMYLDEHWDSFDGLILLGSYSTTDLSSTDLNVLSVYGSEDLVLNMEKYEECKSNLPSHFRENIIEGGCHSYFGMYGNQNSDGTPTITVSEQIMQTADLIADFISMK